MVPANSSPENGQLVAAWNQEAGSMKRMMVLWLLLCASTLLAQSAIPPGTILPVELKSNLDSGRTQVGQRISGRIAQDVPLPSGSKIHAGARILGQVTEISSAGENSGTRLALRFDTLVVRHGQIPMVASLRALASPMEVWDAQIPLTGPDRGTPENAWTTVQVGGDEVVYRGGGPLAKGMQAVGEPTYGGVLARTSSCQGGSMGSERQALWVFSSDACGIYGLQNLTIAHAGRTDPRGEIILESHRGDVKLDKGSGILLRVKSSMRR